MVNDDDRRTVEVEAIEDATAELPLLGHELMIMMMMMAEDADADGARFLAGNPSWATAKLVWRGC